MKISKLHFFIFLVTFSAITSAFKSIQHETDKSSLHDFAVKIQTIILEKDIISFQKIHIESERNNVINNSMYICKVFGCGEIDSAIFNLLNNANTIILVSDFENDTSTNSQVEYTISYYNPKLLNISTINNTTDLILHWGTSYIETKVKQINGQWYFSNYAFLFGSELMNDQD